MPVPLPLSSPGLVPMEEDSVLTGILFSMNRSLQETDKKEVEEVPGVQVIMGYFPQCM